MFKHILVFSLFSFLSINLLAGETAPADTTHPDQKPAKEFTISADDPVVAMLDSLALLTVFRNIEKRAEIPDRSDDFPPGFSPEYSDSVYEARIRKLNAYSPIEFEYNASVKSYINLYAERRRDLTERVLGLAQLYFPLFEEQLDKHNLPLELKYLAVIESALNPVARSHMGATGLWQFMYGTGKMYGLQVNSMIDDRSDIYKSTIAACEHFVDLYEIYNDWNLVLAAYNAGGGNVNRAIRRAGGVKDFWAIRHFLPRETRNYVPAFMGVTYVMEYAREHNLYPNPPIYSHFDVDTVEVTQQLSLRTVSEFLDIPLDHLRYLNPTFRQNIIPHNERNPYSLRLPRDYTGLFIANADTIYNHKTPEEIRQEELAAQMRETTVHVVRRGEVLGSIARRYGTSVRQIQRLNNMRGTLIRPGQRLIVRQPVRPATQLSSNTNTHVVKRGETLGLIASRYGISLNQIRQWNHITGSTIHPGQNLIVRNPGETESQGKEESSTAQAVEEIKEDEAKIEEDEQNQPGEYVYYTVQKGDTLNDIAARYDHLSVDELKELNDLECEGESNLEPGKKIKITAEN